MVKQETPKPGLFLLAPVPVKLEEDEMGLADDLPATVVHVISGTNLPPVRFTPGRLCVTGKLSLGTREEADGRLSSIRVFLDRSPTLLPQKISTTTDPLRKP